MAIYQKKVSVGKWLKKGEDYKDGDILTIANEGQQVQGDYGMRTVFLMKTASGVEASLSFNQTSINNLIDAYGEDSLQWVGKPAKVWLILQSVSGKMQKVSYLTHPQAEIVEDAQGFRWQIPGRQAPPAPVAPTASPRPGAPIGAPMQTKPANYPEEEINPDDIPF